jgi:hypothetical protein
MLRVIRLPLKSPVIVEPIDDHEERAARVADGRTRTVDVADIAPGRTPGLPRRDGAAAASRRKGSLAAAH